MSSSPLLTVAATVGSAVGYPPVAVEYFPPIMPGAPAPPLPPSVCRTASSGSVALCSSTGMLSRGDGARRSCEPSSPMLGMDD